MASQREDERREKRFMGTQLTGSLMRRTISTISTIITAKRQDNQTGAKTLPHTRLLNT
jgi:hypothetical protein